MGYAGFFISTGGRNRGTQKRKVGYAPPYILRYLYSARERVCKKNIPDYRWVFP